jgi:hypothetical protein
MADDEKAHPQLISQARGLLGAGGWLAGQTRPDLQVLVSLGQQEMGDLKIGAIRQMNAIVRRAKQHATVPLLIPSIPLSEWEFAGFTDASKNNTPGGGTQAGSLVVLTRRGFGMGQEVPWGPLMWRSHKLRRVIASTLSAETLALIEMLGHLEWTKCLFQEIMTPGFRMEEREAYMQKSTAKSWAVIDAKSVYDHIMASSPGSGVEDRSAALDFIIARESLTRTGTVLRWGPGGIQLADVLTKNSADPCDTWRAFLRRQTFRLADEETALRLRAEERLRRQQLGEARQKESEEKKVV